MEHKRKSAKRRLFQGGSLNKKSEAESSNKNLQVKSSNNKLKRLPSNEDIREQLLKKGLETERKITGFPLELFGVKLAFETRDKSENHQHIVDQTGDSVWTLLSTAENMKWVTHEQALRWYNVLVGIGVEQRWNYHRTIREVKRCLTILQEVPFLPRTPTKEPAHIVLKCQEKYIAEKIAEAMKIVEERQKQEKEHFIARRVAETKRLRQKRYSIAEYKKIKAERDNAGTASSGASLKIRSDNDSNKIPSERPDRSKEAGIRNEHPLKVWDHLNSDELSLEEQDKIVAAAIRNGNVLRISSVNDFGEMWHGVRNEAENMRDKTEAAATESPHKHEKSSHRHRKSSHKHKKSSHKHRESSHDHKESSHDHKESSHKHKESSHKHKKSSHRSKESSLENRTDKDFDKSGKNDKIEEAEKRSSHKSHEASLKIRAGEDSNKMSTGEERQFKKPIDPKSNDSVECVTKKRRVDNIGDRTEAVATSKKAPFQIRTNNDSNRMSSTNKRHFEESVGPKSNASDHVAAKKHRVA